MVNPDMTVSNYCSCDDIDEIHIRNQNKLILNINKKYENYFNNCFVNGAIYPSEPSQIEIQEIQANADVCNDYNGNKQASTEPTCHYYD